MCPMYADERKAMFAEFEARTGVRMAKPGRGDTADTWMMAALLGGAAKMPSEKTRCEW